MLVLVACGDFGKSGTYRYRMTVEVDTPQGPRNGFAVHEVHAAANTPLFAEELAGAAAVHGDAIVVDRSDGPIFVLLLERAQRNGLAVAATRALDPDGDFSTASGFVRSVRDLAERPAEADLPRADWPVVIRFGRLDDPASAEFVSPSQAGVRRIALRTTREPVSRKLQDRLAWLPLFNIAPIDNADPTVIAAFRDRQSPSGYVGSLNGRDLRFPGETPPAGRAITIPVSARL